MNRYARRQRRTQEYRIRILASLVLSLLVLSGAVMFWPLPEPPDYSGVVFDTSGHDLVKLEQIQPTQQKRHKPPPPAPLPPVVVPDDVVLDEEPLDLQDEFIAVADPGDDAGEDDALVVPTGRISAQADSGPKPVRIVEPEFSREAQRKRIRVEVVLKVLVDESGRVLSARVVERYQLNKDKSRKNPVEFIGFGVEEAAIAAAERWMFRPARKDGQRVQSYTTLTFSFGV